MQMNTYMVCATFMMLIISAGQLFGAASSDDKIIITAERPAIKGRSVDSFPTQVDILPDNVQDLQIAYLPNSPLDRLRVVPGQSTGLIYFGGRHYFLEAQAPIQPSPLKMVRIGQLLNARQNDEFDRTWLKMCVDGDGIAAFVLDQRNEPSSSSATFKVDAEILAALLIAACQNKRNVETALGHLPSTRFRSQ
jgi:hypothetical protein